MAGESFRSRLVQEEEYVARVGCCGAGLVCGLGVAVAVAVAVAVVGRVVAGGEEDSLGHLDDQTLAKETDRVSLEYGECHYVADADDPGYGLDGEKSGVARIDDRVTVRPAAVEAAVVAAAAVGSVVVSVEHGFLAEVEMAVALEMPIEDSVGH